MEIQNHSVMQTLGPLKHLVRFVQPGRRTEMERERAALISALGNKIDFYNNGSKLVYGKLSPGCRACMQGTWSCLYINHKCTAHCFFCPQDRSLTRELPPFCDNMAFESTEHYLQYLEHTECTGVSLTGGEPLLVLGDAIRILKTLRRKYGDGLYLWLYSNGDLFDDDKLKALHNAGLDEIRINIVPGQYGLERVEQACAIIKNVTVELPVVPEDMETLKKAVSEMALLGVSFFNIHQLLTTRFNVRNYIPRKYTLLKNSLQMPVWESEINALQLLNFIVKKELTLSVNYCSQAYKDRYQEAAYFRRMLALIKKGYESITNHGFLRTLSVPCPDTVCLNAPDFRENAELWIRKAERLYFHPALLDKTGWQTKPLTVEYHALEQAPVIPPNAEERFFTLNGRRMPLPVSPLFTYTFTSAAETGFLISLLNGKDLPEFTAPAYQKIRFLEKCAAGLASVL